ncbi:bacteriocin [Streptococcus gallolyticus]|uniref:Bacteriocin n=1 Tax=Streptococcus gallolyticus TaxID=315405 RepID=A0A368UAH0_9STRE|nr:bacteriocin [Streptococcus gallolyticus]
MFETVVKFFQEHKTVTTIICIVLLLAVYPSIFKIIYESGRDFGRSIVNLLLP